MIVLKKPLCREGYLSCVKAQQGWKSSTEWLTIQSGTLIKSDIFLSLSQIWVWGIEFSRSRLMIQYSENHFLYYSHYYHPQNWHCDNVPSTSVSQVTSGISHFWPPMCSNTNETWHNFPGLKSWDLNLCLRPQPLFFLKYVTDSCLPIIGS